MSLAAMLELFEPEDLVTPVPAERVPETIRGDQILVDCASFVSGTRVAEQARVFDLVSSGRVGEARAMLDGPASREEFVEGAERAEGEGQPLATEAVFQDHRDGEQLTYPEAPFVLHLPNVMHLATDVAGVVHDADDDSATSLDLAAALHPSAAVGGTPTEVAKAVIAEIEGMDRGRYAGPVGWMDASGDGEWGIALRSAMVTEGGVRLFAGCGIVASSDPEAELAESQAKFVPVRDALGAG